MLSLSPSHWLYALGALALVIVGAIMLHAHIVEREFQRKATETLAVNRELAQRQLQAQAVADSLRLLARSVEEKVAQAKARALSRVAKLDTVYMTLPAPPDTCKPWANLATSYRLEVDTLRIALDDAGLAIAAERDRGASLETALGLATRRAEGGEAVLKTAPGKCTIFGDVGCPVLTAGAIMGSDGRPRPGVALGFPIHLR